MEVGPAKIQVRQNYMSSTMGKLGGKACSNRAFAGSSLATANGQKYRVDVSFLVSLSHRNVRQLG